MAENTFVLRTLTPERTFLEEDVRMVIFRTMDGDMGILPGHEPCAILLDSGRMRVRRAETFETYLISGGFAMVDKREVVVMTELAERADRMEALLQEREQQRRKRKKEGERWENEITRAEMAIRRVLTGQETSAYSILKGKGEEGEAL